MRRLILFYSQESVSRRSARVGEIGLDYWERDDRILVCRYMFVYIDIYVGMYGWIYRDIDIEISIWYDKSLTLE